jgi:hypothetical protein
MNTHSIKHELALNAAKQLSCLIDFHHNVTLLGDLRSQRRELLLKLEGHQRVIVKLHHLSATV